MTSKSGLLDQISPIAPAALAQRIEAFYRCERERALQSWSAFWAEDARITFPFAAPGENLDIVGKAAIVAATARKFTERGPSEVTVTVEALAHSLRVLVRMRVIQHSVTGPSVTGPLVMVFTFDEKGLITLLEEYFSPGAFRPV